jgi:integrase
VVTYSTWVSQEQRMRRYIKPRLGHHYLHKITQAVWEKALADIVSEFKLSPGTYDLIRSLVSTMYRDAIRRNHAAVNPIEGIERRADKKKVAWKIWRTEEECLRYLRAASAYQSTWFYPMVALAVQTGAREGELIPLRWDEDLNLENGTVRLWRIYEKASKSIQERTKGGGERWQALNPSTLEVLREYRASLPAFRRAKGALAFSREDGGAQNPRRICKIHHKVCERAGVPKIRFHDLRHQYASLFSMRGGNPKVLQKLMGHSTLAMTERYAHMADDFVLSHAKMVEFEPIRVNYDSQRVSTKRKKLRLVGGKK